MFNNGWRYVIVYITVFLRYASHKNYISYPRTDLVKEYDISDKAAIRN